MEADNRLALVVMISVCICENMVPQSQPKIRDGAERECLKKKCNTSISHSRLLYQFTSK